MADFWGSCWNTSFSKLANDRVFRPLARPIGIAWATLAVFLRPFWTLHLVVAMCVFNLQRYLTDGWRRAGLASANLVFASLPLLYGWIALRK